MISVKISNKLDVFLSECEYLVSEAVIKLDVSISAGYTAPTLIPFGAYLSLRFCVKPVPANFDEEWALLSTVLRLTAKIRIFTIDPPFCSAAVVAYKPKKTKITIFGRKIDLSGY